MSVSLTAYNHSYLDINPDTVANGGSIATNTS